MEKFNIGRFNKDDLSNINYSLPNNQKKTPLSLITNDNFNIERKPIQMSQKIESYKYMKNLNLEKEG